MRNLLLFSLILILSACKQSPDAVDLAEEITSTQTNIAPLPPATQTDKTSVANLELELLDDNGNCVLNDGNSYRFLRPMAPCYFIRVANSLQVYQSNQAKIIAIVGTPVKKGRCGQQVQGLIIDNNTVRISERVAEGSTVCADKGLDAYHFSLFENAQAPQKHPYGKIN